jgi:ATP-dependent Clp protease ATP-binding subunit ClpB
VGKTELAKALADVLFDDEKAITRIDMSEYQERHTVSRLVGAPPGYVGYDEGGQLTEAVRRRLTPSCAVGRNRKGPPRHLQHPAAGARRRPPHRQQGPRGQLQKHHHHHDLQHGAETILENFEDFDALGDKHRAEIIETTKVEVLDLLKQNLRPEFLNRIDEQIVFLPLTKAEIKQILQLQLRKVEKMLARQRIVIKMSDPAMNLLADLGYEPQFGARPMKRVLQKEVINELSRLVLSGTFGPGDTIYIHTDAKGLTFLKEPFPGAVHIPEAATDVEENEAESPISDAQIADSSISAEDRKRRLEDLDKATKDLLDTIDSIAPDEDPEG